MYRILLTLHILGATVWTGGHLIIALAILPKTLRTKDLSLLQAFESRYEPVGIPALVLQAVTGLWLAYLYLPEPSKWFSFDGVVSVHITLKIILLALTVALALHARLRFVAKLSVDNLRPLAVHIITVTVASVLMVIVGVGFRV